MVFNFNFIFMFMKNEAENKKLLKSKKKERKMKNESKKLKEETEKTRKKRQENKDRNIIQEGKVKISVDESVFYNPFMEINRDISSLAVGALVSIKELGRLNACDGMAASGIRGLRYLIENDNVDSVTFVDGDEQACNLINKNIEQNLLLNLEGSKKTEVVCDDINHHLYRGGKRYNFIELDPFGSPVPFIRAALLNLRGSKIGILSVTATDTAVLCGAHSKACVINYGAKPMHNSICHEVGLRILIADIVRTAAPMHLGITPLFSISKRHYMKVILLVKKSAKKAYESMSNLGFVSMCQGCMNIETYEKPHIPTKCNICGENLDWAGPLWLGPIFDEAILKKMKLLNQEREYRNKKEIESLLRIMIEESKMPAFYYDLHAIADHFSIPSPSFDIVMNELKNKGYSVTRTHFNPTAIKTDAKAKEIIEILKK
jgi:tRNA (guanine26-N2/guanine27-N2)-dimethyltransferase